VTDIGRGRLLVADDEESIRFAMSEYFGMRGYTVDCARDLDEAVALLGRHAYGVVVADLRLSATRDEEGFDLIGHVRQRRPATATILLTAHRSPAIDREARRRGVDVVMVKPQPLSEIARVIDGILARRP